MAGNNNVDRASIFVTKLKQKTDRNGNVYLIGNLGMAGVILTQHKTENDSWNMRLLEAKPKEEGQQRTGGNPFGNKNENQYDPNEDVKIPF